MEYTGQCYKKSKKTETIAFTFLAVAAASGMLFFLKQFFLLFIERTNYTDKLASLFSLLIFASTLLVYSRINKIELSVYPKKFGIIYIFFTLIFAICVIFSPSNFSGDIQKIILLIYGCVITPTAEELFFRGILWNRLKQSFSNDWTVYIINVILFGLWHLGFYDTVAFRVSENLLNIMFWKFITGICYGLILGFLRMKFKNCYITILLHGILNVFGR